MTMSTSTTGRFLRGAAAALAVTVSLGAASLATVSPAEAYYGDGYHHRHVGFYPGVRHYGYGYRFHPRGFAYRPFVRRSVYRPVHVVRVPFYAYGHRIHRAWGPYGWHHRAVY